MVKVSSGLDAVSLTTNGTMTGYCRASFPQLAAISPS